MLGNPVFQRFLDEAPVCVMARATLENVFAPNKLDTIFEQAAEQQYERELLFSTAVEVMSLVVCRVHPSVHAVYQRNKQTVGVSVKALYDKLNRVEPQTSRELVRHSARETGILVQRLQSGRPAPLPGYRIKILDGNHLEGTQHRLKPLRTKGGGALPGQCLAVLDPHQRIILDVLPCEDAYTQECRLALQLLEDIQPRDVLIDDRQFCTSELLFGLAAREACFVTRQHAGHLRWELSGDRRSGGRTQTGRVWEQTVELSEPQNDTRLRVRRITLVLDQPTREGDRELHILTNLPARAASARRVAELYRDRWRLENAFQELTTHLRCELNTLGYPPAALFGFCTAAACYNLFAVIQAALAGAHGEQTLAEEVSHFFLTEELSGTYRGMMIALPPAEWRCFQERNPSELVRHLRQWARHVDLSRYRKHRRGPKTRPRRPPAKTEHFATARLLKPERPVKNRRIK